MRLLFVQPSQGDFVRQRIFQPGIEAPLNVACLAAYMEQKGVTNSILDMRALHHPEAALVKVLQEEKPHIVGISAFTAEARNA
ncbi:MAG TPA: hypothetical protein PKH07_00890 [bacterium]|nr:hypothetical protein [bacterium]